MLFGSNAASDTTDIVYQVKVMELPGDHYFTQNSPPYMGTNMWKSIFRHKFLRE